MKTLLLIALLAGTASADQASDSFVAGLANGFNKARYGQQQEQKEPETGTVVSPSYYPKGHYDAVDNYGQLGTSEFATYSQCSSYIAGSQLYHSCVWVGK